MCGRRRVVFGEQSPSQDRYFQNPEKVWTNAEVFWIEKGSLRAAENFRRKIGNRLERNAHGRCRRLDAWHRANPLECLPLEFPQSRGGGIARPRGHAEHDDSMRIES